MRLPYDGDIDINGARLHVTVTGEGETIVLVHSGITDWMWDGVVRRWSSGRDVRSARIWPVHQPGR